MMVVVCAKEEVTSSSSSRGLLRLQQLYQSLVDPHVSPGFLQIRLVKRMIFPNETLDFLRQRETMDRESKKYIVLDCSPKNARELIISHVRDIHMGRRNYHYLLSGLIMDEPWDAKVKELGALNITGFRVVDRTSRYTKTVLDRRKDRKSFSANAALMHDAVSVFIEGVNRLLERGEAEMFEHPGPGATDACLSYREQIHPWVNGTYITNAMRTVDLQALSGRIKFNNEGQRIDYMLDIVEMTIHSDTVKIGTWSPTERLRITPPKYIRISPKETETGNRTYIVTSIIRALSSSLSFLSYGDEDEWRAEGPLLTTSVLLRRVVGRGVQLDKKLFFYESNFFFFTITTPVAICCCYACLSVRMREARDAVLLDY
ncbi:unnamed protein product [Cyprideis torosa]|uniref:Receptor ligand binding region domain-containing protein n=1 Tax=Cyprideis torosa TaxID=163714 RepID=A0A7R8WEJ0_9CRUS|nr:unnamed protein product [Cyprideis torosa]CAG0892959.1 unnamed protein product [Cyprideis torosa]